MAPRVGDLLCPGIDVDAFKAACRIPLYPQQWNVWVCNRTLSDEPDHAEIVEGMEHLLGASSANRFGGVEGNWQHELTGDFTWLDVLDFTGQEITTTSGQVDEEALAEKLRSLGKLAEGHTLTATARRETSCPGQPLPLVKGPTATKVVVIFFYRGTATSGPWPVFKPTNLPGYAANSWCPTNAKWVLDSTYQPLALKPPPDEYDKPIGPDLPVWKPTDAQIKTIRNGLLVLGAVALGVLALNAAVGARLGATAVRRLP